MKYSFLTFFLCQFAFIFGQTPATFAPCNKKTVFAVDDYFLSQAKGKLPAPDVKPEYSGGSTELFNYFSANEYPLNPQPFTVTVAVLINCKAQAGNYEILTKHSEATKIAADAVMEQVAKLPALWQPGKSHGRFVDCYQVVQVLIQDGKVVKMGLK